MPIALVLTLSSISFVSSKGYRILATLFAVSLGAGPFETGILFALWGIFPFILSVYAGRLADRFDNRVLMYLGLAGFSVSLGLPFFFPTMFALYLSAALGGFTSMLFVVATQNLVGVLSSASTRTRHFSYYSMGESLAAVAGPVLVGLSIDAFRHPLTFLVLALINAACLAILFGFRSVLPHTVRHEERKATRNAADLLALPALRNALVANGVVMAGLDLYSLYMPIYAHGLGYSATAIGLIMGAFGVAAFLTRVAIPPVTARWGEAAMLSGALALAAAAFVAIPFTQQPLLLGAVSFLVGLGIGCGQPLTMILSFNSAPPGRAAEAIAMRLAVSYGAHVVIPPAFGVVGAALGLGPIFWTCALLIAGGSWITRRR